MAVASQAMISANTCTFSSPRLFKKFRSFNRPNFKPFTLRASSNDDDCNDEECAPEKQTLSASDLRDPEISALIASKLKEFHGLQMPGPKEVLLWGRLRNWLKTAKSLCSSEEAKDFQLDAIEEEISFLEKELSGDQGIGFCHNDLQYGNIMIDEETKAITIIDIDGMTIALMDSLYSQVK